MVKNQTLLQLTSRESLELRANLLEANKLAEALEQLGSTMKEIVQAQSSTAVQSYGPLAEIVKQLENGGWARNIVLNTANEAIMESEAGSELHELLIEARSDFQTDFSSIADDPHIREESRNAIYSAIFHALTIGAISGSPELRERMLQRWRGNQARLARKARAESPAEMALAEVVKSLNGPDRPEKPSKEAQAILVAVNSELERRGFSPVKVDVVRRRLERLPRS